MANLDDIGNQLKATESQMAQYGGNFPSEMETQIQKAYTPLLERSLGVTKDLMSDYLGRAMETTSMGPGMQGTTAYDLSPSQRMGVIGRELGTMGGQLNAAISYSDYLGGQMNDLYQKALSASQMGYQNLADQYARQMQMYQLAWQEAENEKDRRLQQSLYRPTPLPTPTPEPTVVDELDIFTDEEAMKPGGVLSKKSTAGELRGKILPNTGGQVFNQTPAQKVGLGGATNRLMPTTSGGDALFRSLYGGSQGPLSGAYAPRYPSKIGASLFKF